MFSALTEAIPASAATESGQPRPRVSRRRASPLERLLGLVVAILALGALTYASSLTPAPIGHGTHTQTGMPACGWLIATGHPCPTCGMTTAIAHAARGELARSFTAQPFGLLLAVAAAAAVWIGLTTAVFGSRAGAACGKLLSPRVLWLVAGLWAASWIVTIARWPR